MEEVPDGDEIGFEREREGGGFEHGDDRVEERETDCCEGDGGGEVESEFFRSSFSKFFFDADSFALLFSNLRPRSFPFDSTSIRTLSTSSSGSSASRTVERSRRPLHPLPKARRSIFVSRFLPFPLHLLKN